MSLWNRFFDELDRVFRQVAQLLKDADALFAEQGYVCCHSAPNQIGTQVSYSMQKPSEWYPRWVVRFYVREDDASICMGPLVFLAVFLSDEAKRRDWARNPRVEEPLVVAGIIDGQPGKVIKWKYWMCKWWFWNDDAEPNGSVLEIKPDDENTQFDWERIRTLAIPLSAVHSMQGLKERATDPLMALLGGGQAGGPHSEGQTRG